MRAGHNGRAWRGPGHARQRSTGGRRRRTSVFGSVRLASGSSMSLWQVPSCLTTSSVCREQAGSKGCITCMLDRACAVGPHSAACQSPTDGKTCLERCPVALGELRGEVLLQQVQPAASERIRSLSGGRSGGGDGERRHERRPTQQRAAARAHVLEARVGHVCAVWARVRGRCSLRELRALVGGRLQALAGLAGCYPRRSSVLHARQGCGGRQFGPRAAPCSGSGASARFVPRGRPH